MQGDEAQPIRVVVAEDEPLFRDLLVRGLSSFEDLEVVAEFDSGEAVLARLASEQADVVLLDIHLAGALTGVATGVRVRREHPGTGVVLLSSHADPGILSSLPEDVVGAWSYLLKPSVADLATVARAVRGSAAGLMVVDPALVRAAPSSGSPVDTLTGRQLEVLQLVAQGYTNRAISQELVLSEKSVENHLSRIYLTLGIDASDPTVHARVQATLAMVSALDG
ncbi:MAG: response regulator transcription factor [Actinomycetes bacterium]